MKSVFYLLFATAVFLTVSCKTEEDPNTDNPNVDSRYINTILKNFYPKPSPSSTFEQIYNTNFSVVDCSFSINLNWYDPETSHGIYLHFNNSVGDALLDANGFVKSFNSGIKIDSILQGTWSGLTDGRLSYDYLLNPSANKGNIAGQGDKYIVYRAYSETTPQLKYYGWLRVKVSENGREVKVISIGYQKNPNTALFTGEL